MGQYLDKFKDVIGKRQTQQIINLLNQRRNTGQIRTIEEFSKQLEDLVRSLTETNLKPSLSLFLAKETELTDSESVNFMLERVEDDLIAAFEESDNIDEVQKSHEAIIRDVIFKNLKAAVGELDSKIRIFEFLNKDNRGFDSAIFSTFRESKENRTKRGDPFTAVLFRDLRTGDTVNIKEDAVAELIGERLTLANQDKNYHTIHGVRQIFDDSSPQSELLVTPANIGLGNLIDGKKGTYWVQALLYTVNPKSVTVKLEFDLGIIQEINFIEIEQACKYGIILEDISYIDSNNSVVNLGITEQEITSPVSLQTKKIAARKIILTFRNEHWNNIQFEYDPNRESLLAQALLQPPEGINPELNKVVTDLDELMSSIKTKDILGITPGVPLSFNGYEFLTGFDNIRLGLALYRTKSIYVSSPMTACSIGQLGLKTIESRPFISPITAQISYTQNTYDHPDENEDGGSSTRSFLASIEYWIFKQDYAKDGSLIKTSTFPILPFNIERIYHERLILTEKSSASAVIDDIGSFVFFTTKDAGDIKIYRNFELLEEAADESESEGWLVEPLTGGEGLRTPNSGSPMKFKVRILNPLASDIFTVIYTPLLSTTRIVPQTLNEFIELDGVNIVDLVGDMTARSGQGQLVYLDEVGAQQKVKESKVYLIILFRQNTADISVTPSVEEYMLFSACQDSTKFESV